MAAAPKVIRNFNLFVDGTNYAGLCTTVTLPSLRVITDEHRAAGMDSAVLIDLGVERMELSFTLAEHHPAVFRQFGLISGNDVSVIFRAAKVGQGSAPTPYYVTARGMYSEVAPDAVATGEKAMMTATISLRYYLLELDGAPIIEIDVDNYKRVINGVDQLQGIKDIIDA